MKIILGVYFVIQILVLSSLMVLSISLPLHAVTMAVTCLLYLAVAFKKPGYFENTQKQHSLSDQIHRQRKYDQEDGMKEIDEAQEEESQNQKRSIHDTPKSKKKANLKPNESENIHNKKTINKQHEDQTPEIRRYCRICRVVQPLRVRHCHECEKCIFTFDHHCPWMSNCIGEKNRSIFLVYLFAQFLQFLFAEISVFKAISQNEELQHAYFFAIGLTLVMLVSLGLFIWQTFLMLVNLTTWEYVRWNKIEYLSIYSQAQNKNSRSSPFSRGWNNNIVDYFMSAWLAEPYEWKLNALKSLKLQRTGNKKESVKIKQKSKTEKVISRPVNEMASE